MMLLPAERLSGLRPIGGQFGEAFNLTAGAAPKRRLLPAGRFSQAQPMAPFGKGLLEGRPEGGKCQRTAAFAREPAKASRPAFIICKTSAGDPPPKLSSDIGSGNSQFDDSDLNLEAEICKTPAARGAPRPPEHKGSRFSPDWP